MIIVIDYGLGNLGSVQNMIRKLGALCQVSSDIKDISKADKLILPGVGAFDRGISNIKKRGFISILTELVMEKKVPLLGICLGMQLLTKGSEEGLLPGLGWIDAMTIKFNSQSAKTPIRIPHMGWNTVMPNDKNKLFDAWKGECCFYFVHSYHVVCSQNETVAGITNYGVDFVSAFEKDNIMGVQFHPEKSHKYGMKLLKNFVEIKHA